MISKKDITKLAKKIMRRQRGLRDHQIIHPQREWVVGLVLAILVVAGIAVWSSTTYLAITDRSVDTTIGDANTQTVYRTEVIDAALTQFRERAENYEQLLENRVTVPVVIESLEPEVDIDEEELETDVPEEEIDSPDEDEPDEGEEIDDDSITPDLSL